MQVSEAMPVFLSVVGIRGFLSVVGIRHELVTTPQLRCFCLSWASKTRTTIPFKYDIATSTPLNSCGVSVCRGHPGLGSSPSLARALSVSVSLAVLHGYQGAGRRPPDRTMARTPPRCVLPLRWDKPSPRVHLAAFGSE